jgi:uncharacterized repeat protein (TIGR01451 family)
MSRRPNRTVPAGRRTRSRKPTLEILEVRELLTGYTVTSVADNGSNTSPTAGSLRAAILAANADPTVGADTISFDISGGGVQTIDLPTFLPAITRTVVIDGDSQPGFSPGNTPVVVIDGSAAPAGSNGLMFAAGSGSVVRGLSIVGFATNGGGGGAAIDVEASSGNNLFEGDYLGIEPDGSTAKANYYGIFAFSSGNTIGGSVAAARNVISGNANAGIVLAATATGNLVAGDYVGTNVAGNTPVGNLFGVVLAGTGNTVGGLTSAVGNLISGNDGPTGQTGIGVLFRGPSQSNVVEGNKIGTDVSGMTAVPDTYGVYFGTPGGSPDDNVALDSIGGTIAGAGNLISGNFIGITGNVTAALIAGNTIGLNVNGNAPLPNGDGIFLGANGSTIGGSTAAARNVISGNSTATGAAGTGMDLTGDSDLVIGNYIGLTTGGVGATGTGNVVGLAFHGTNTTIGGTTVSSGNAIAGNSGSAITIDGDGGIGVFGNVIGLTALGGSLPNGGNGIAITVAAPTTTLTTPFPLNDTIGGTASGAGNTIFGSGGAGIVVNDNNPTGITGLGIRGNTIFSNAKLGIDLNGSGVPIPSTLFVIGDNLVNGKLQVVAVYFGAPSTSYGFDFFANGADASGYGQGPVYLGSVTATTNISGFVLLTPTFTQPATPYASFSATATGPDGNTTGFAANFPTTTTGARADLTVVGLSSKDTIVQGNSVTFTETVINDGPNAANNVMFADTLPTSLVNAQITSTVGTPTIDSNNVILANLGTLASGASDTITITVTASQPGQVADSPGVSSTTYDPSYANNQDQHFITVQPSGSGPTADLAISEVALPATAKVGTALSYVVTVLNNGPNIATNASVNDFLPTSVTFVSATPSQGAPAVVNGTYVSDNLGTIGIGASATFTIVVIPTTAGSIVNAVNVSGNQFDPVSGNNSASLTTTVAPLNPNYTLLLSETASASPGLVGQNQVFTITATNLGPDSATNATLFDLLPTNAAYVTAVPTQGATPVLSNGRVFANFGTIAPGGTATLTLIVTATTPGIILNAAGIYSPDAPNIPYVYANNATVSIPSGPSVIGVIGHNKNSALIITFDEALNASTATNKANYKLVALGKKGQGPNKTIAITSATYNAATHTVTITPSAKLDPTQYYQIQVIGSTSTGIADIYGRHLVNPQYTTPGANFSGIFFAGTFPQG